MYQDYNALLRSQNLIDYDDILLMIWRILSEREAVGNLYRRLYKYVLVDEAQDLSFAQYELIRALCGEQIQNVMLVRRERNYRPIMRPLLALYVVAHSSRSSGYARHGHLV